MSQKKDEKSTELKIWQTLRLHEKNFRCFAELLVSDYETINKREYKNGKFHRNITYINLITAFDIETSSFILNGKKCACMYCWQFGINGKCYVGRTWEDFERCMKALIKFYDLKEDRRLIIWDHNLPYEFQWLLHRFKWTSVFAREEREPMKANTEDGFEFRCSLVLAGCSLAKVAENLTMFKIKKLVGDLDYKKIRGSDTPLKLKEMQYAIHDVLIVMAYIAEQISIYGDMLKIPMTNTGRVRKACKKNCLGKVWGLKYHKLMQRCIIQSVEEYNALRRAFQGGFTHANWRRANEIIENLVSRDETSAYPTAMLCERFPMGKAEYREEANVEELEKLRSLYKFIFDVKFINLRPKEDVYEYPISKSKCLINGRIKENNGRVISAEELITTTTDVDFYEIISTFYTWDKIAIKNVYIYPSALLPTPLVQVILSLYKDKTTLKDIPEKSLEYLIKKGMLNSTYGCSCQSLITEEIVLNDGKWETATNKTMEEVIEDYNNDRKRFLFYPWGVFITSYARRNLFMAIKETGQDYCYSDTDSVKFTNFEKHKEFFEKYNEWITRKIEIALKCHKLDPLDARPKTIKGVEKPLGVWDDDGTYFKFKTLGAKRYIYTCNNPKKSNRNIEIHCTVAGVNKKGLAEYLTFLQKHYGGDKAFNFFSDEMEVPANFAHKTTALYSDEACDGEAIDYMGNKFHFKEKSFVYLDESDYNMKLTPLYKLLLYSKENYIYG